MVISCSVPTCKNRFLKGNRIQFHSFPLRRGDLCRLWAEAIGREDWNPTKNSFVCSVHFRSEDYQARPGKFRPFLSDDAVPSVFSTMMPRRKNSQPQHSSRASQQSSKRLPFILPSHLEITSSPSFPPMQSNYDSSPEFLPTTLPSGVSITPLKRAHPRPPTLHPSPRLSNGGGAKRMRNIVPKNMPGLVHPGGSSRHQNYPKPMPNLTPIHPRYEAQQQYVDYGEQNGDEDGGRDFDVTQFLSISLQPEETPNYSPPSNGRADDLNEQLRRKCSNLNRDVQKRDSTIRSLQHQMRELRKKMDSISIKKILNDHFKGLTYEILENFMNNTKLDSCDKTYSPKVKDFAKKLYSCSPEAYALVRAHFDLPHTANVAHWLLSNGDGTRVESHSSDDDPQLPNFDILTALNIRPNLEIRNVKPQRSPVRSSDVTAINIQPDIEIQPARPNLEIHTVAPRRSEEEEEEDKYDNMPEDIPIEDLKAADSPAESKSSEQDENGDSEELEIKMEYGEEYTSELVINE